MISSVRRQFYFSLFLIFSLGGFFILAWSAHDWFQLMSGERMGGSFCNLNSYWNCDRASFSPMGSSMGIPVGVFGALWFLIAIVLGLLGDSVRNFRRFFLVLGLAAVAFMASYLFFVLKAGCLICVASYLCIVATAYFGWSLKDRVIHLPAAVGTLTIGLLAITAYSAYRVAKIDGKIPTEEVPAYWNSLPLQQTPVESPLSHGDSNARVKILEFSDFGCPYCALAGEVMVPYLKTQADVQIQFFPFPFDSECNPAVQRTSHAGACRWTKVALCAQQQGKFWPIHDWIFGFTRRGEQLPSVDESWDKLNLDIEKAKACVSSAETDQQVRKLVEAATQLGVNSTPTFVINGRIIKGFLPMPLLRHLLKEARQ